MSFKCIMKGVLHTCMFVACGSFVFSHWCHVGFVWQSRATHLHVFTVYRTMGINKLNTMKSRWRWYVVSLLTVADDCLLLIFKISVKLQFKYKSKLFSVSVWWSLFLCMGLLINTNYILLIIQAVFYLHICGQESALDCVFIGSSVCCHLFRSHWTTF